MKKPRLKAIYFLMLFTLVLQFFSPIVYLAETISARDETMATTQLSTATSTTNTNESSTASATSSNTSAPVLSSTTSSQQNVNLLANPDIPYGETVASDIPGVSSSLLGPAQYFSIFANSAVLNTHTNGNIAVGNLDGSANFGTSIHPISGSAGVGLEINYIQKIENINGASFVTSQPGYRTNKAVFGMDVPMTLVDQNNFPSVQYNDLQLGHLATDEVFQDKEGQPTYINFASEFTRLANISTTFGQHAETPTIEKDFTDENNRYIDVSNATTTGTASIQLQKTNTDGLALAGAEFTLFDATNQPIEEGLVTDANGMITVDGLTAGDYHFVETKAPEGYQLDPSPQEVTVTAEDLGTADMVYINLTKDDLAQDRPITIKGLSSNGPSVIINVDTQGASTIDVNSQIKLEIDGSIRQNQETENFTDAVVMWNFTNRVANQVINIDAPFQGTILAPGDIN